MKIALMVSTAMAAFAMPAVAQTIAPVTSVSEVQEVPAEPQSATDALTGDIVITATKRASAENVQDVAIAVTALGAAQIEARFVRDLQSISYDIPNVQLEAVGTTAGYANFSIRGLGINSSIPSIDPTVGVFVDGIYLGINAGVVFDNFDLEGIEVLRGPQGLLFGRNVTGGAVVLRTSRPTFDFTANARVALETGLNKIASAVVSGPIVGDVVAAKLAVYYNDDDGWFTNRFDNGGFGRAEQLVVRPAIAVESGPGRLDIRFEHGEANGDGPPGQNHALFRRDSFDFSVDNRGFYDNQWTQAIVEANLKTGFGSGAITNISGFRRYTSRGASDIDATPNALFNLTFFTGQSQLSNELRYAGTFGPVELTTGLYYFTQELDYIERRNLLGGRQIVAGGGHQDQSTAGAFTSADVALTDTITLNLGARYSYEKKEVEVSQLRANGCSVEARTCNFNFFDSDTWRGFTPKLGLQWKPGSATQVYGFYTRGFRSGGYNFRNTDPNVPPGPFDQETQDSIELGLKQEFGRGTRINAAVFHNIVDNLQREINLPGPLGVSQVIRNTAKATIRGFEAEGQLLVARGLLFDAQVGYVDGQYDRVLNDLTGDGIITDADRNLKLPRLSPWTYGIGATVERDLGTAGRGIARASFNHRDRSFFTDNNAGFLQGANILEASLTLASRDDRIKLSVYGKNLLDEVTIGGDTQLPAAFGGIGASFSPLNKGRVIGAEVAFKL